MKPFYDFLNNLDGRICFIICVVGLAAVFLFSLIVMLSKRRHLPLGRITALAAISCGLLCYFMTLCTDDAAYAPSNAAFIVVIGGALGLVSAAFATFSGMPSEEDDKCRIVTPARQTVEEEDAARAFVTEDIVIARQSDPSPETDDEEVITAIPLPTIDLPQAAQPSVSYEEVLERAESARETGITLAEAKELVTQINKLKVLPENSSAECQQALMLAQQNIVSAVKSGVN